jgi:hypothetical protein
MNVREMLKIQQAFENKTTPEDLLDEEIIIGQNLKRIILKCLI